MDSPENKSPFWAFQLGGWALFFLILLGVNLIGQAEAHWTMVALAGAIFIFGLVTTSLFRSYIRAKNWIQRPPGKLVLPAIIGSLITTVAWAAPFLFVQYLLGPHMLSNRPAFGIPEVILTLVNNFFIVLLWCLLYFAFHYFRIGQLARVERYRTEAAMRDAQLNTLRGQINPHFMFNSLNNIRALMLEDVERSREMVTRLSDLLRYSMTISEKREVNLSEEIEVVQDFLELCKVQYEERLQFEVEIAHEVLDRTIPPMIIQILVENSVKHGIGSTPGGGKVSIKAFQYESELHIEVRNTGNWNKNLKKSDSHGIGLPNIRRRLQIIYGDKASMHLSEEDSHVVARIKIPL